MHCACWSCPLCIIGDGCRKRISSNFLRQVLDVLTIVALKTLSNYVNHIAHMLLDPQFAPQAWKAQAATVA